VNDKICVECQLKIEDSDYQMVALEYPYTNLFFHRECFDRVLDEVGEWCGLALYLASISEKWYNRGE
jgi:hypothetical protein